MAGRIRSIEKSNDFIGNRTRVLPACSIVSQANTLPRAPLQDLDTDIFYHDIVFYIEVWVKRTRSSALFSF
jgi:hypothetical protein